jgi:hypothetical protein
LFLVVVVVLAELVDLVTIRVATADQDISGLMDCIMQQVAVAAPGTVEGAATAASAVAAAETKLTVVQEALQELEAVLLEMLAVAEAL